MTWNFDMAAAPRGKMVKRTRKKKDGETSEYEEFEKDVIIAGCTDGLVTMSYWIPKEERWCMFTKERGPDAWMPWPKHPINPAPVERYPVGDSYVPVIEDIGGA